MSDLLPTDQKTVDYLDHPPQRYDLRGLLRIKSPTGAWVKFQDMDDYMLEGGQLMVRMVESRRELLEALKRLVRSYVNTMESGRDRIVALGGDCDPVDVMERGDPYLRLAKDAIAKAEGRS